MPIPSQASWVVRKILIAREYLVGTNGGIVVLNEAKFFIRKAYHDLRGDVQWVDRRKLICNNSTSPKCVFIV